MQTFLSIEMSEKTKMKTKNNNNEAINIKLN